MGDPVLYCLDPPSLEGLLPWLLATPSRGSPQLSGHLAIPSAAESHLAQGHALPWQGSWHPMTDGCTSTKAQPSGSSSRQLRRLILVPKVPVGLAEAVIGSTLKFNFPLWSLLLSSPLSHRNGYWGQYHPGSHPLYFLRTSFIRGPPLHFSYYKLLPMRHLNILTSLSDPLQVLNPTLPSSSCPLALLCFTGEFLQRAVNFQSAVLRLLTPSNICHPPPNSSKAFSPAR